MKPIFSRVKKTEPVTIKVTVFQNTFQHLGLLSPPFGNFCSDEKNKCPRGANTKLKRSSLQISWWHYWFELPTAKKCPGYSQNGFFSPTPKWGPCTLNNESKFSKYGPVQVLCNSIGTNSSRNFVHNL